jgi:dipeptidyl aminopeptidase/acylaminoacyl peptidase
MADLKELLQKAVVYSLPGMEQAQHKKDLVYHQTEDGTDLKYDLYYPAGYNYKQPLPAVILVHGDGSPEMLEHIKDSGQYRGWGQLMAASNLIGITFNHRSSEGFSKLKVVMEDLTALIQTVLSQAEQLNLDPQRLGLMVFSAGTPYGLSYFLAHPELFQCGVTYYGAMDLRPLRYQLGEEVSDQELANFSPVYLLEQNQIQMPPLLVVKAALDRPGLNALIDQFVQLAQSQGRTLELLTHSQGRHGFDILDDDDQSRQIIQETLRFLQRHLQS